MRTHVICNRFTATVFFLAFFGSDLFAQQQKVDSLEHALKFASRLDSFNIHNELTIRYGDELGDRIKSLYHAKQAYRLASRSGDTLAIVTSGSRIGQLYHRMNMLDSALLISEKILPIARRNNLLREVGYITKNLGLVYSSKPKYDLALQYLFESLTIKEQLHDTERIATILTDIGFVYYKIFDDNKALKYYQRALEIKTKMSDTWELESLLLNISLCHSSKHDFKQSRRYINQAKQLCLHKNCSINTKLELEIAEGLYFLRSDSLIEAEKCFMRGLPLTLEEQNTRLGLDCLLNLSKIYLQQNKIDLATTYLKQVEESENTTGFNNELLQLYTQLIAVYKKANNYKMMAHYQDQYIHLRDSVSGDEVRNNLMRVQAEYLERENEAKIKSQAELLVLQDDVIARQGIVRTLVIAVVVLFIILALILYRVSKNKNIANALLDQQVAERTKELEISYRNLKVAMEQRDAALRKVASEIRTSMITVTGLCATGAKDVSDPESIIYLENIDKTSNALLDLSSELASETLSQAT